MASACECDRVCTTTCRNTIEPPQSCNYIINNCVISQQIHPVYTEHNNNYIHHSLHKLLSEESITNHIKTRFISFSEVGKPLLICIYFTFTPRISIIIPTLPKISKVLPVSLMLSLQPSSSCKNPINSRSNDRMGCDATRSRKF